MGADVAPVLVSWYFKYLVQCCVSILDSISTSFTVKQVDNFARSDYQVVLIATVSISLVRVYFTDIDSYMLMY